MAGGKAFLRGTVNVESNPPDPEVFSESLFAEMKGINPGIEEMELYEFRYALDNLIPASGGWASVELDAVADVEQRIHSLEFYDSIQIKPRAGDRIVLDETIVRLTNMLFVGLVLGAYPPEWVRTHFYFDIRGFFFLTRTPYFTADVVAHLGGQPFRIFEQKQKQFERCQELGYKAFREANAEVDEAFIESVKQLVAARGTPLVLAIAGPTAAGKTEIVQRLHRRFEKAGKRVTSIEMDNFLTDRDQREEKGIYTFGKKAIHFDLLQRGLNSLLQGHRITISRYDFIFGTSSHDAEGRLKVGRVPIEVEPADIIFMEGNFPFLLDEIGPLIGIKVVYLTDDAIRLKRKWRRDIDYRKKYEPTYFRNRYFRNQFLMAHRCYRPQLQLCDLAVDTTGAALWVTPEIAGILDISGAQRET